MQHPQETGNQKVIDFCTSLINCGHSTSASAKAIFTLRASCSAVYCNRSCLFVCVCVCGWVCYHDNSKLRASILTKLGL